MPASSPRPAPRGRGPLACLLGPAVAAGALALVAVFVAPGVTSAFVLTGDVLGISTSGLGYQRDVRVQNSFPGAAANDNQTPDPAYPGALGASLAVWKGVHAWASDDPNAGKNFDVDWQGEATGPAGPDSNVVRYTSSPPCGGSVVAFIELPSSDGWRINLCAPWDWSDGPGAPDRGQLDIQGVVAREYGFALGLGVTSVCGGCATMCPVSCDGTGVAARDIEADDAAGLAAIYGEAPANKPAITGLSGSLVRGGTLVIEGTGFGTLVNVKFTAGTSQDTGAIPGVLTNVPATNGGTRIEVTIPAEARSGNVLVWEPTLALLSNAFPLALEEPPVLTGVSPPTVAAFAASNVTLTGSGLAGVTSIDWAGQTLGPGEFTVMDDTEITLEPPAATALGPGEVTVTSPGGTSVPAGITTVETDPPAMTAPASVATGASADWAWGAGAGDTVLLLAAATGDTFVFKGFDVLSGWVILLSQPSDAVGLGGVTVLVPPGLEGVMVFTQVAAIGPSGFTGASGIAATTVTP